MASVVPSLEVEFPLYTISCYRENLFRVVKRCFTPSQVARSQKGESQSYEVKLSSAVYRARSMVREYALCNDWDFFCTFTLSKLKIDRYDLKTILLSLMKWLDNRRQRNYPNLRYLLIPEPHEDGAWHLHGFFSGVPLSPLPDWAPRDLLEGGYQEWTDYRLRFGWNSFAPIRSAEAVAFYVTKYITKNLANSAVPVGVHLYYHSRGLRRALKVGYRYWASPLLDGCLKNKTVYWHTAFFKLQDIGFDDFGNLVDLCDEVTDMYQSYVIEDPDTREIVSIFGGDDDDEAIQMAIAAFTSAGYLCDSGGSSD